MLQKKVPCKREDDRQVFHADLPQQFVFWSKEQLFALQVLIAQTCLRPFCVPFHASTPDDAILVQPEISFFFLYTRYNLYTHHHFIYTITYIFLPILFVNFLQIIHRSILPINCTSIHRSYSLLLGKF